MNILYFQFLIPLGCKKDWEDIEQARKRDANKRPLECSANSFTEPPMTMEECSQPSSKKRKSALESIYCEDAQGDIDVDTDGYMFCDS